MKKLSFFLILSFVLFANLFAVMEETASFKGFLYGSAPECEYDNWLSHVAEGIAAPNYNIYAPWDRQTDGFGDFTIPDSTDLANWSDIIDMFLSGELDSAQGMIDAYDYPYEVVIFHDTDYNRTYYMLREIPNFTYYDDNGTPFNLWDDESGAFDYAWGLYVYYPDGPFPHITTAPHPNDDFPSVPMAYEVFTRQQSKFLIISGTGREVKWTEIGNYTNSKSLCDPSRVELHPFNVAYHKSCDKIRSEFGRREFSIQVHSYDWGTSHPDRANVQISGGNQVINPDLPIRDNSLLKKDIVNATNFIVHPTNDIGIHAKVDINEFYGIHYLEYPFTYSNADTTVIVNNDIDLPGYSQNRQMVYTQNGFSQYDNFEPFFHIEMDELPNTYPQSEENYYWFYAYNPLTQEFQHEHIFDKFIAYYLPWVNALTSVLPDMFQMNDNTIPIAPTNFESITQSAQDITLHWTIGDSYDIYSYEIFFAEDPISDDNYQIINREDNQRLASLAQNDLTLYNLESGENYYFKIRIKDKNGNFSDLSDELVVNTGSASFSNFYTYGRSDYIDVDWTSSYQDSCSGFNIYRKTNDTDFILLSTWQTNTDLLGNDEGASYYYQDNNVQDGVLYTYKLSSTNANGEESFYGSESSAVARYINKIIVSQQLGLALSDTSYFGYNEMATDDYDYHYDIYKTYPDSSNYFFCQFYEPDWNNHKTLERDIMGYFDPQHYSKSWTLRVKTDQLNIPVQISMPADRDASRCYFISGNNWINLGEGEIYEFTPTNTNYYTFGIVLGNAKPPLSFYPMANQLLYPFEMKTISWDTNSQQPINSINVFAQKDDISIPIAQNLPSDQTEVTWNIPPMVLDNIRIRIDLIMPQGDTLSYFSPYKFGIVSFQTTVSTGSGWSLITQNFSPEGYSPSDIYGNNPLLYQYENGQFTQTDNLEFLSPYWLNVPQDNYFTVDYATIQKTAYSYSLHQGWNIIPNPHKIDYDINQLVFITNNVTYEYYQAVDRHFIEPFAFDYNDKFETTTTLTQAKSYYLYSYIDYIDVVYIPFFENTQIPPINPIWKVEVSARYFGDEKSSSVVMGTAQVADSLYNNLYDILKPMDSPIPHDINFSLINDFDNDSVDENYYQIFNRNQSSENVEYIRNAHIEIDSLQTIAFRIYPDNMPDNYLVYLDFDGDFKEIFPNEVTTIEPDSLILDFRIVVSNYEHSGNGNDELLLSDKTGNYPNPFNPSTTIYYTTNDDKLVKVEIYNLKGQKVKTLVNDVVPKGYHKTVWDGKNENNKSVASGMYFYRLQRNGNKPVIKKIMLIK